MTQPRREVLQKLTPVLTKRWLSPDAWKIDTYERLDGYAAVYGPGGRAAFVATGRAGPFLNGSGAVAGKLYDYHRGLGNWPRRDRPFTAREFARSLRFGRKHGMVEKSASFEEVWDMEFWR